MDETTNREIAGTLREAAQTRVNADCLRIVGSLFEIIEDQSLELRPLAEIQQ